MTNRSISIAIVLNACLTTHALAQETRTDQIDRAKAAKAGDVQPETRETGDVVLTKIQTLMAPDPPALKLSFGGLRPGAGLTPGVAFVAPVGGLGLATTKAAWSVRNFKLVESALELPPLAGDRVKLEARVRWEDAPRLSFFGIGNDTPGNVDSTYALRSTLAGGNAAIRVMRHVTFGGGAEYLSVRSAGGDGLASDSVVTADGAPAVGVAATWLHTTAYASLDRRASPGYTESGSLYQATWHDYADRDSRYSFRRTEIDLRQFIPLVDANWIVALQGRADLTSATDGQVTPYFMLPYVGGGGTLRGFRDYRFTDRDSLLLRAELRWAPTSVVNMAVFVDEGEVAPRLADFNLHGLRRGWGIGARFHGPRFTALRIEVAHGDEGWRYHIAQGVSL